MFIFCIRSFNDIDHMVPVIYKLAKNGLNVKVLCQNPEYDITSDFRLNYLHSRGVVTQYIPVKKISTNDASFCSDEWALKYLKALDVSVIIFDYVISVTHFWTGALLQAASDLGVPTVGMAPGVPIFAEDYLPNESFFKHEVDAKFDFNIVPHAAASAFRVKHGISIEKIAILGSPRFCPEWRQVLGEILEDVSVPLPVKSGRLRVVYMERGADLHGKFGEKIADTILQLCHLDFIDFLIKPHPRYNNFQMDEDQSHLITKENSLHLIEWADVVIGTNTSILVDVLASGKILLYPKYFHADRMIFDVMEACLRVDNYIDLEVALRQLYENKNIFPYSKQNVKKTLDYLVFGGVPDRDVLDGYCKFLLSVSNT